MEINLHGYKSDELFPGIGVSVGRGCRKGHEETLGVMDAFIIFITAMVFQVYLAVKTYQIVHF